MVAVRTVELPILYLHQVKPGPGSLSRAQTSIGQQIQSIVGAGTGVLNGDSAGCGAGDLA
eukprot:scaffold273532_cov39-Tisochrysis_lutea.AAC.2